MKPELKSTILSVCLLPLLTLAMAGMSWGAQVSDDELDEKDQVNGETVPKSEQETRRYHWLPVPIIITEPAIGEGLGAAIAVFHPAKQGNPGALASTDPDILVETPESMTDQVSPPRAPPVVTGIMAAYTNNDTWFAGAGHVNNWRNDSIRYAGILAAAHVNSRVYPGDIPVDFKMETRFTVQSMKFRLGQSNFMLGTGIEWMDAENRFSPNQGGWAPDISFATDFRNVGLFVKSIYDSRDSATNPESGQNFELDIKRYDQDLGGDFDYWRWNVKAKTFHKLSERFILGFRLDVAGVDGSAPFTGFPFVELRGIPAMRYQGEVAGAIEGELRYRLASKWQLSAFGGVGNTRDSDSPFPKQNSLYTWGFGGRYKVIEAQDIWVGVDVARGPEDWNWYIQVGQAW